jgi:hypothetical protein
LYRSSEAFKEMVAFMGGFRDYAPYNVMLVRLQNRSCGFFAPAPDWWKRHQRCLIDDARPMLILGAQASGDAGLRPRPRRRERGAEAAFGSSRISRGEWPPSSPARFRAGLQFIMHCI